jgi:hypothetical protein
MTVQLSKKLPAVGLVLKSVDKNVSLGMLFIAVQFADILFLPLTLDGDRTLQYCRELYLIYSF